MNKKSIENQKAISPKTINNSNSKSNTKTKELKYISMRLTNDCSKNSDSKNNTQKNWGKPKRTSIKLGNCLNIYNRNHRIENNQSLILKTSKSKFIYKRDKEKKNISKERYLNYSQNFNNSNYNAISKYLISDKMKELNILTNKCHQDQSNGMQIPNAKHLFNQKYDSQGLSINISMHSKLKR